METSTRERAAGVHERVVYQACYFHFAPRLLHRSALGMKHDMFSGLVNSLHDKSTWHLAGLLHITHHSGAPWAHLLQGR